MNPKFPWADIGKKAYLVFDVQYRPDLTITTQSAHVKIVLDRDLYKVRLIVFEKPGQKSVDHEQEWSPEEIRLAFNLEGNKVENDFQFAKTFEAEFGIKNKFVRIDNHLVLFSQNWLDKVFPVSVLITQEMKDHLAKFVK